MAGSVVINLLGKCVFISFKLLSFAQTATATKASLNQLTTSICFGFKGNLSLLEIRLYFPVDAYVFPVPCLQPLVLMPRVVLLPFLPQATGPLFNRTMGLTAPTQKNTGGNKGQTKTSGKPMWKKPTSRGEQNGRQQELAAKNTGVEQEKSRIENRQARAPHTYICVCVFGGCPFWCCFKGKPKRMC